jgi:hypothetical protein
MSPEKILLLGSYLRLTVEERARRSLRQGGPAASSPPPTDAGSPASRSGRDSPCRPRARGCSGPGRAGGDRTADAAAIELEAATLDVALCLGAAFVWIDRRRLGCAQPAVKPGGFVAIGEPFWRR